LPVHIALARYHLEIIEKRFSAPARHPALQVKGASVRQAYSDEIVQVAQIGAAGVKLGVDQAQIKRPRQRALRREMRTARALIELKCIRFVG
jgi:hypothetical protein